MRFKQVQKNAQNTCGSAHNNYIRNMVSEPGSKNKKLYSNVKVMKCDSSGVATLKRDGTNYSEANDKAEILSNQFASAFTREDFMRKSIETEAPPLVIKDNGVKKICEGLNPHKARGPDEISSSFLKEMANSISPALTLILQASYDQGTVSTDWKGAFVTPLFKMEDKSKASNYRPVSLTSICSKAMEHTIHSHLMKYLDSHHTFSDLQHGFKKRRSCESQLITTSKTWPVDWTRDMKSTQFYWTSSRRSTRWPIDALPPSSTFTGSVTRHLLGFRASWLKGTRKWC